MMPRSKIGERLIFLHIPKAAGTTLQGIIQQNYKVNEVSFMYHQPNPILEIMSMPESRKNRIRVLYGHYPFGLHGYLPGPFTYLTMLRNPIDRVISLYYYILKETDHYLHKELISKGVDLETFVKNRMIPEVDNGQVRLLKGMKKTNFQEKRREGNALQCPPEWLDDAKQNLKEYFPVVGLSEKFDESLILFRKEYGWGNINYVKSNVAGRGRGDRVSEATRDLIRSCNELDFELYHYAGKLFEEKIAAYGPAFGPDLEAFRLQNSRNVVRTFVNQRILVKLKRHMNRFVSGNH